MTKSNLVSHWGEGREIQLWRNMELLMVSYCFSLIVKTCVHFIWCTLYFYTNTLFCKIAKVLHQIPFSKTFPWNWSLLFCYQKKYHGNMSKKYRGKMSKKKWIQLNSDTFWGVLRDLYVQMTELLQLKWALSTTSTIHWRWFAEPSFEAVLGRQSTNK